MTTHDQKPVITRSYEMPSKSMDNELGPLNQLPGKWKGTGTG